MNNERKLIVLITMFYNDNHVFTNTGGGQNQAIIFFPDENQPDVLLVNELKWRYKKDELREGLEKIEASTYYVSLHKSQEDSDKENQREFFKEFAEEGVNLVFIEEHHNSGQVYDKLEKLTEHYKRNGRNQQYLKILGEVYDLFELERKLRNHHNELCGKTK